MSDNLKVAKTTLAKLHRDMEAVSHLAKPPSLNVIEQRRRMMESICKRLEISRTLKMSGATAWMQDFVNANQHWQEMIKQATATSRIAENLTAAHQSWVERIKPIQSDNSHLSQLQALAKLDLCDVSLQLAATERLMAGIDFEAIRSSFQIEMPAIPRLEDSITHAATSYRCSAESLREISDIMRLPNFVLPGATREIYTTSFALNTLHPRSEQNDDVEIENQLITEAETKTSGCIALLQQVDPRLARPYIGARDALHSSNADRARHILVSLREMWNHLLRRLAPNDLVVAWIPEAPNQKGLLHEGKPTRRAKVLYVCRELNNDPLTDFLADDTQALVRLIELFNQVHALETKLTDEQLRAIFLRTDSWLMYILQISEGDLQ